jgi:soluble cytochrome b562
MDFKKLAEVQAKNQAPVADSTKKSRKEIMDAIAARRAARKKAIEDAQKAKDFKMFKVTDGYKNLRKKIKDALEETETTEAAIEAALQEITPEAPAEQVLAAVIEILGETIDELEGEANADPDPDNEPDPDEPIE